MMTEKYIRKFFLFPKYNNLSFPYAWWYLYIVYRPKEPSSIFENRVLGKKNKCKKIIFKINWKSSNLNFLKNV